MTTLLKNGMKPFSLGLSFLIVLQFDTAPAPAQTLPKELNVIVVAGDGAVNNGRQRASVEPVIRVEDESHKPISGVAVVFTLPTEGATGEFGNGSKTLTVMTDSGGEARGQGLKVNQIGGTLPILVNVSYRGLRARATITQSIVARPGEKASSGSGGSSGKRIAILVVLGAAAAGGAVFATQKGSGSGNSATVPNQPSIVPIGVTAGTGTIAPPPH